MFHIRHGTFTLDKAVLGGLSWLYTPGDVQGNVWDAK